MTDRELWERYRQSPSPAALGEVVRRHVDWVYSAARRKVGDAHLAEDVTQAVFLLLVQKAPTLRVDTVLPAWLLQVTRYAAATARRTAARRRKHEHEAAAMLSEKTEPSAAMTEQQWAQLAPMLDDLVSKLREKDRQAVLLRFYQAKSFAEVSAELGISEEAGRKRVTRAIERLRRLVEAKGLIVAVAALPEGMLAHTTQAAPVDLADLVIGTTSAPTAQAAVDAIAKGAIGIMTAVKVKALAAIGGMGFLLAGVVTVTVMRAAAPRAIPSHRVTLAANSPASQAMWHQQADPTLWRARIAAGIRANRANLKQMAIVWTLQTDDHGFTEAGVSYSTKGTYTQWLDGDRIGTRYQTERRSVGPDGNWWIGPVSGRSISTNGMALATESLGRIPRTNFSLYENWLDVLQWEEKHWCH